MLAPRAASSRRGVDSKGKASISRRQRCVRVQCGQRWRAIWRAKWRLTSSETGASRTGDASGHSAAGSTRSLLRRSKEKRVAHAPIPLSRRCLGPRSSWGHTIEVRHRPRRSRLLGRSRQRGCHFGVSNDIRRIDLFLSRGACRRADIVEMTFGNEIGGRFLGRARSVKHCDPSTMSGRLGPRSVRDHRSR